MFLCPEARGSFWQMLGATLVACLLVPTALVLGGKLAVAALGI